MQKITIAIDGHSSCGKSTLTKALAAELSYTYVDTGAMYRAFTLYCLHNDIINDIDKIRDALKNIEMSFVYNPTTGFPEILLNNENVEDEIRQMRISENVSKISEIKEVRKMMVQLQREMGSGKGVVMEGRDIGTVVFPDAELKLFMTADVEVRAQRRYDELIAKGVEVTFEEVKENLEKRDYKDTHRAESPLIQAQDAIVLDSTRMNRQEQLEYALQLVEERLRTLN